MPAVMRKWLRFAAENLAWYGFVPVISDEVVPEEETDDPHLLRTKFQRILRLADILGVPPAPERYRVE